MTKQSIFYESPEQAAQRQSQETKFRIAQIKSTKTLRDEFAMAALTGMTAHPSFSDRLLSDEVTDNAYKLADAMLAARVK